MPKNARAYSTDIMKGEGGAGYMRGSKIKSDGSGHLACSTWAQKKGMKDKVIKIEEAENGGGTSVFDPVLCEIVYRWFCTGRGSVLDPFAGGSVRGVVAGVLGHPYTGIDLRADQIEANEKQADTIKPEVKPKWITGNSEKISELAPGQYDLVFSCPPYYDLEIYSDSPGDLSALGTYEEFITTYRNIIAQCCGMLKPNRFACFVVGDIRDKKGFYRGFVGDTIRAFEDAGCQFYNEGILVNVIGSLPIRITKQFEYRKLGKCHQNVLVFFKGDPKKIKEEFGTVQIPDEAFNTRMGGE